jgi:hypothetical protein
LEIITNHELCCRATCAVSGMLVLAIPPPVEAAKRRMAGRPTVTSHSLDATAVTTTAEAVAQVF